VRLKFDFILGIFLKLLTLEFYAALPQQHGGKALPYRCTLTLNCGEAEPRRRFEKNSEPESRRLSAVCGGIAAKYRSVLRSLEMAKLT
jgi:hypothetical protein